MALSVPSTGQAITFDIGNANNVHLEDKEDVGHRLACVALWNTYSCRNVAFQGPTLDHVTLSGNTYQVFFKNAVGGLVQLPVPSWQVPAKAPTPISQLGGFQIAGANKVFYSAVAQFDATHSSVLVSSPSVPSPVALRYGFVNNPVNLQIGNVSGLPAEQFRTDNWPENPAELDPTTVPAN
jgi:sialate O-acetylesterase